jgi:hypothetical protein
VDCAMIVWTSSNGRRTMERVRVSLWVAESRCWILEVVWLNQRHSAFKAACATEGAKPSQSAEDETCMVVSK